MINPDDEKEEITDPEPRWEWTADKRPEVKVDLFQREQDIAQIVGGIVFGSKQAG